eukprot:TRINITY_DN11358_c0_g1_i1.p1 TRINITY_DN11358_c0_g1~~TRINITY_DN11358_c0_g1_i1.p1  ORF type:complete len:551 (+),score=99.44 TRINITY_DN11358_c0_g1_i1:88-1740(+)
MLSWLDQQLPGGKGSDSATVRRARKRGLVSGAEAAGAPDAHAEVGARGARTPAGSADRRGGLRVGDDVELSERGALAADSYDWEAGGDALRPGEWGEVVRFDRDGDPVVRGPRGVEAPYMRAHLRPKQPTSPAPSASAELSPAAQRSDSPAADASPSSPEGPSPITESPAAHAELSPQVEPAPEPASVPDNAAAGQEGSTASSSGWSDDDEDAVDWELLRLAQAAVADESAQRQAPTAAGPPAVTARTGPARSPAAPVAVAPQRGSAASSPLRRPAAVSPGAAPAPRGDAAAAARQRVSAGLAELRSELRSSPTPTDTGGIGGARRAAASSELHFAAMRNDTDGLLACGLARGTADPAPASGDWTPLHVAVSFGSTAAIRLLHDHGASVYSKLRDGTGRSALHIAPNAEVVNELVARGAFIGSRDAAGRTPLSAAVALGRDAVVEALLSHGAQATAEDAAVAEAAGHSRVAELVRSRLREVERVPPQKRPAASPAAGAAASHAAPAAQRASGSQGAVAAVQRLRQRLPARVAYAVPPLFFVALMIWKTLR